MKSKKIYFCASIRGGRDESDIKIFHSLIKDLKNYGIVLTEHIISDDRTVSPSQQRTDKEIHDRDVDWLTSSDVVIAEVTIPSLGVGYEIGKAVALNKPILCLFRSTSDRRLSAMIRGAESENFHVFDYERFEDAANRIAKFFESL